MSSLGSIYDTKKFTRSPACDDLWGKPTFHRDIAGLDPRRSVIIFPSPIDKNEKVRLEVSTKLGSLYVLVLGCAGSWEARKKPGAGPRH